MRRFRPRLVLPAEYAGPWIQRGHEVRVSPSGRLVFVSLEVTLDELSTVLEEMTAASADWLRQHPEAPPIVEVARYEREPKGLNDYLHIAVSLGHYAQDYKAVTGHRVFVDCEDLEIATSAELRVRAGIPARPGLDQQSEEMWHVVTIDGTTGALVRDTTRFLLSRHQKGF